MTTVLALSTNQLLWWITLAAGLVVAVVVTALLEALRQTVVEVDRGVAELWTMGKRLAQNTQAAHILETTKARGGDLLGELEHHRGPAEGGGR